MQSKHLNALLRLLDETPESAGLAYQQLHQRMIRFFRLNNGSDPESLADEALDRLGRRIAETPGGVVSPQAFALGIGRHLLQEDARRQRRHSEVVTEWAARALPNDGHDEGLLQALEHCMALLREDQRQLLGSYYQWSGREKIEHHRKLAETLGVSINAMRNRLMRARSVLDKCIRKRCSDVFRDQDIES